jgi:thiamine-monophosphate kinase
VREFDLLDKVFAANALLPAGVSIPPGDDMGAVACAGGEILASVDQVADGVHVDSATMSLEQIGRKAMVRSLSDIAAMAALPVGALATVCLPRRFSDQQAEQLFQVLRQTAAQFACPLIGGDVAMWDHPLIATVSVWAQPAGIEPVLRRGAVVGDAIYVTGRLGGSLLTLNGYCHHLDFTPRIALARKLAGEAATRPHCMIDLSDGLASDLRHLCAASHTAARIDGTALPISSAGHQAARQSGKPAWQHAVGDGEDYELLFTAPMGAIPDRIDDIPITCIGKMDRSDDAGGASVSMQLKDESIIELSQLGWEHHS